MTVHPSRILGRINTETRAGVMLRRLCAYHPTAVDRTKLALAAGILPRVMGPVSAAASFYWSIERANDELRRCGWEVVEDRFGKVRLRRVG